MKNKLLVIFVFVISFFSFSFSIEASCFKKCESNDCDYVESCSPSNSITCESAPDSYCDLEVQIKKVYCGSEVEGRLTGIPKKLPELTSLAVTIIQIVVPVILVAMGSIDLFKGITANKEDEMKKGQQMFIKRLVVGAIIFFIIVIVKFLISIVADTNSTNIVDCIDCFVSNDCEEE